MNRSEPPNNAVNPSVVASRRLQSKRRASRPAGYGERSADYGVETTSDTPPPRRLSCRK